MIESRDEVPGDTSTSSTSGKAEGGRKSFSESDFYRPSAPVRPRAGTPGNESRLPDVGSLRGRDGAESGVLALQAPARPPRPSRPLSEPPPVVAHVGYYRKRAEELGDMAAEFIEEGLPDLAASLARMAATYGDLTLRLYAQRARELQDGNPEWLVPGHASNFLPTVVLFALPLSGLLWVGIVLIVKAIL